MKKLILSFLFLFPVIAYSASAFDTKYSILNPFLTDTRSLKPNECSFLSSLDTSPPLLPHNYKNKKFWPPANFTSIQKDKLMLLPVVIDSNTNEWVAYAIFMKQDDNTLYLDYLIVGADHQKKGIGTMIIDWLFKELKPKRIRLKATSTSAAYYEKLGFINGQEYDDYSKTNPYLES